MLFQFCPSVLLWNNNNMLTTIFSSNDAVCVVSFGQGKKGNVMFDLVTLIEFAKESLFHIFKIGCTVIWDAGKGCLCQ